VRSRITNSIFDGLPFKPACRARATVADRPLVFPARPFRRVWILSVTTESDKKIVCVIFAIFEIFPRAGYCMKISEILI
jgi:hypothetical protein